MNALGRVISAANCFQGPSTGADLRARDEPAPYKEWFHFCVVAPEMELLVNFNVSTDLRPAGDGGQIARMIFLARVGGAWQGGLETIAEDQVRALPGSIDLSLGQNTLSFDGAFHLTGASADGTIVVRLDLEPVAIPLIGLDSDLGLGSRLSWVVIPALRANGVVVVSGNVFRLRDAAAYHDHNWGSWRWGHDFAWQWGFALPASSESGLSLVYSRLTNRARTRDLDVKLCLWRGPHMIKMFDGAGVTVAPRGRASARSITKIPPIMSLLSPGSGSDVPHTLEVRGESEGDFLSCRFEAQEVAQIIVPNETDPGLTRINEAAGRVLVAGQIRGAPVHLEGRGIFEFLDFD